MFVLECQRHFESFIFFKNVIRLFSFKVSVPCYQTLFYEYKELNVFKTILVVKCQTTIFPRRIQLAVPSPGL